VKRATVTQIINATHPLHIAENTGAAAENSKKKT
jgi:hypothetical protein